MDYEARAKQEKNGKQSERTESEQRKTLTNEALAVQAKAGDQNALAALWERNRGLLALMFRRLAENSRERMAAAGVTIEDLEQEGYFAMMDAVRLYDTDAGTKFTTFLRYPVMNVFFSTVGLRLQRQKQDPLCKAASLDEVLDTEDGDGSPRGDLVPDVAAEEAFRDADERIFNQQLRAALDESMGRLNPRQAFVLRSRFYDGNTQADTAAQLNVCPQYIHTLEQNALRAVRHPANLRRLEPFRAEIVSRAYRNTGFCAWKTGGSSPERWVEWIEHKTKLTKGAQ